MKTKSPFGDTFEYYIDESIEVENLKKFVDNQRKNVVIQGLGFVGAAMVAALSTAKNKEGECLYNVIGIDLLDEKNYWKIALTNSFKPPVVSTDKMLFQAYEEAGKIGNLMATYSNHAYSFADIVIIDIHLDIKKKALSRVRDYDFTYEPYEKALQNVANQIKEDVLVIVETTVPPGTTEKVTLPIFHKAMKERV